jgi:hypothetical protein
MQKGIKPGGGGSGAQMELFDEKKPEVENLVTLPFRKQEEIISDLFFSQNPTTLNCKNEVKIFIFINV